MATPTASVFTVTPDDLAQLDAGRAVEVFRDLVWCQARRLGVPVSKIRLTQDITVADGGIDAEIVPDAISAADDVLVAGNTFYQLKTGTTARPWQEGWLKKELFGERVVNRESLGDGVRRCLDQGGRYVIACFGVNPTGTQIAKAQEYLAAFFTQCGHPGVKTDVWGQTTLVGLLQPYPSLCLSVTGRSQLEFQSLDSWRLDSEMSPSLHLAEAQQRFIAEVRECVGSDGVHHLRVIGEPGLGKTRLLLEALSAEHLAPLVIYVRHAEVFQRSHLFNELLRPDNLYSAVLVIDECSSTESASIWSALKLRSDRIRLITVDHGPEIGADDLTRVIDFPRLPDDQITAIIREYLQAKHDASRWAAFCSGSPRVAHAVGQNLQRNPDDILKSPATVPIWDRFVSGYTRRDTDAEARRLLVLRHVALFLRFGFEPPVDDEGQFIADLVCHADPGLTSAKFQEIIYEFKQRRILQGRSTLFIVPTLLQVHLWRQFWEHHGRGFLVADVLRRMPPTLYRWFIEMFRYAHASEVAMGQVVTLLAAGGPFSDERFMNSKAGGAFLNALAEAAPQASLDCIERTIGTWSRERLLEFHEGRQYVVWALEKIAVWPDCFCGAARMLLKLGEAENATNGNNASGVFRDLFGLARGLLAPTGAAPATRLPVLREALASSSEARRNLGLGACKRALDSIFDSTKMIGPEHQGVRPTMELWSPRTWDDFFDAFRAVWKMLRDVRASWQGNMRAQATAVLVDAAFALIRTSALADMVLETLEQVADDPTTNRYKVVEFITHYTVHLLSEMPRLTEFDLNWTTITDEGLQYLAQNGRLTALSLRGTAITDRGVRCLRGHRALASLDLSRTDITGAALEDLAECPALAVLLVYDVNIDEEALGRFREKRPDGIVKSGGRKPKE